jgi:hypothetical protein
LGLTIKKKEKQIMTKEEIQQRIDNAVKNVRNEYKRAKTDYDNRIIEIDKEAANMLPLKVGDILTRYGYEHCFNRGVPNLPIGKERVRITRVCVNNTGAWFHYQKWGKKTNKWLKKEYGSYSGFQGMMCLYEKDGIFYGWGMNPNKEHELGDGYDEPTQDMEIKEV